MHYFNANDPQNVNARRLTVRKLLGKGALIVSTLLLLNACGGSNVGEQNDQRPPTAEATVIGLIADDLSGTKVYSTRANNEIVLTGKNSTAGDSPIFSYNWTQTSGETVALTKRTQDTSVFTTPNVSTSTTLTFTLTTVDGNDKTSTDSISITVAPIDDVNGFLKAPSAPESNLKVKLALRGGDTTGSTEQTIRLEFVTIAHWVNRLGVMDQIQIQTQQLNATFPSNFNPAVDYDVTTETRNPTVAANIYALNADDINRNFETSDTNRRLDTNKISSAYIEIQINVVGTPAVDFELFAVSNEGVIINGANVLSPDTEESSIASASLTQARLTKTNATNGALLQTWNNELSAALLSDNVLAALGLENRASANNYYVLIDPEANFSSLNNWLAYAGFDEDHAAALTDNNTANAIYFNNYDLGYGRNTWLRQDPDTGNVFSYVTNFPSVEKALQCQQDFSVFAMEYSDNPNLESDKAKIVKFYAFIPDSNTGEYVRTNTVNIDGRGEKAIPGVCTACHQSYTGTRTFLTAADADLNAAFIPLDLDALLYASAVDTKLIEPSFQASKFSAAELTKHSRETMEAELREINAGVLATYQDDVERHQAAIDLLAGWYGGVDFGNEAFDAVDSLTNIQNSSALPLSFIGTEYDGSFVQAGWIGQEDLYNTVFKRTCRTCHTQIGDSELNFDNYDDFINNENLTSHVYEQGLMPLSRFTMDRFWVPFYKNDISSSALLRSHLENLGNTVPEAPGLPVPKFTISKTAPTTSDVITLDASPSSFARSYTWTLNKPDDSEAVLSNNTGLTTSFTPDISNAVFDVSLTITNKDDVIATLTKNVTTIDRSPVAECFSANTSSTTNSGLLTNIPVLTNITNVGDGGLIIESATDGSLGKVTINSDDQTLTYQLTDPFVRGIDTITYRLADSNGSLSTTSTNCSAAGQGEGFAAITIDTTTAGTYAPANVIATLDSIDNTSAIDITWDIPTAVTVDGYNIYYNAETLGSPLNEVLLTSTSFNDSGLTPETTYSYQVTSVVNGFEFNPSSATATTLSITPTELKTTSVNAVEIDLNWTAPTGNVDSYVIYREDLSAALETIDASATNYKDVNVSGGNQYQYTVTAIAGFNESVRSNNATGTSFPDSPSAPIAIALSDSEIDVSWSETACSASASYILTPSGLPEIPTTSTNIIVSGLSAGNSYTFTVSAQCHGLLSPDSAPSEEVSTLGITPTGLVANSVSTSEISLSWDAPSGSFDSYKIYRNGTEVGSVLSSVRTYTDTKLVSGTKYSYEITAVSGTYESSKSNVSEAPTYPSAPTGVPVATAVNANQIDVSWNNVSCSDTPIYILIPSGLASINNVVSPYSITTALTPSTAYTFTVVAQCNGLNSDDSSPTTAITTHPAAPDNVTATTDAAQITLSWTAPSGSVDRYFIYKGVGIDAIPLADVTETSYTDTENPSGHVQAYTVTAVFNDNESVHSSSAIGITLPDTPIISESPPPIALSGTEVELDWSPVSCSGDTVSYNVTPNGLASISTTMSTFIVDGLTPLTTYTFTVNAQCHGIRSTESVISQSVTTLLATPTGLTATAINDVQIDLTWDSGDASITAYDIFRDSSYLDTVSAPASTYSDSNPEFGITGGRQYSYEIVALASMQSSLPSSPALATTYPIAPAQPYGYALSDTEIDVSWSGGNENCDGTIGYRLKTSGGIADIITATPFVTVSGLTPMDTYTFVVTTICLGLESVDSETSDPVVASFESIP